ncbi:SDR family NAD(P)-dependent oxidoreductase [Spartinivicinus poritis]|uniref:SDR family NAD(P)-dependent oxidoreductase n=1 Tax=Spartinivicinus poritis TaxID=2994640 RepID=A0ABT5U5S3_9GAMM|nr:SDR family oxidoreductase [Spartinivicinus sp. A2-2]MDE1461341.1 SDR family NAD(P)-dependent oxidoreductase [Spartinivicinus sp. A2-2]
MISLKNKTILLTGASGGIGLATAKCLLKAEAKLILHYNSASENIGLLQKEYGSDHCHPVQANLARPEEVDRLWQNALDWQGTLDGVVNNAAFESPAAIDSPTQEWRDLWQATLDINVVAVADLCRYAITHYQQYTGGVIINLASRAAFRGDLPDMMHYAASKGAIVSLTRSIAKAYAKDRIYAFNIAPGWINTDRIQAKLAKPGNEALLNEVPTGKPAPPEEVANIIAFLLSGLSNHATGATIDINGASYFH